MVRAIEAATKRQADRRGAQRHTPAAPRCGLWPGLHDPSSSTDVLLNECGQPVLHGGNRLFVTFSAPDPAWEARFIEAMSGGRPVPLRLPQRRGIAAPPCRRSYSSSSTRRHPRRSRGCGTPPRAVAHRSHVPPRRRRLATVPQGSARTSSIPTMQSCVCNSPRFAGPICASTTV